MGEQVIADNPPDRNKQDDLGVKNTLNWKRGDEITASKLNETVAATQRAQKGVGGPKQLIPKVGAPVGDQFLYIRQDSSDQDDMPTNGNDFAITHRALDINFFKVDVFFTAGTFSVRLKINGILVGPTITQASVNPIEIDPVVEYKIDDDVTLHVNSSSGMAQFEIRYTGAKA